MGIILERSEYSIRNLELKNTKFWIVCDGSYALICIPGAEFALSEVWADNPNLGCRHWTI